MSDAGERSCSIFAPGPGHTTYPPLTNMTNIIFRCYFGDLEYTPFGPRQVGDTFASLYSTAFLQ